MILQSEILRIAENEGVLPDTIDKNWVLGHFLAELFRNQWAQDNLVFKGGTCLKKCYFKDYRFSEDLDFTLTNEKLHIIDKMLQSVCDVITAQIGIFFSKVKIEPILWNYMLVGYSSHIQFWGANHKKGHRPPISNRWHTEIKIEIVFYELIVYNPEMHPLFSDFSDSMYFENVTIPCYKISEMVAEKFRALLQRSYPAPRDYYDLWYLLKERNLITWEEVMPIFIKKLEFKKINFCKYDDFFNPSQIKKVEQAWNNSLRNHLSENKLPDSELVLTELKEICEKLSWG